MARKKYDRTFLERWLPHPLLTLVLILLWMALLNNFTMGGLVTGTFLGVVIPIITSHFWPDRPPIQAYRKALSFMMLVAWDVVVANVQVAYLILFCPADRLRTRWISLPIELDSPEAITMLAATITMTPGTVSSDVSADGKCLLVHCLDAPDVEETVLRMKTRYEARIKEVFR